MASAVRAAPQLEAHAAFEPPIQNGLGQVTIMHDLAERRQRLVGGQQEWAAGRIAFVDDAMKDPLRVRRMREVAVRR